MITVALPTWQNKDILWLPLEGLARQKCSVPWELVVMECESDCKELILSYKNKLEKAGCADIRYIHSPYRMPLAVKWKMMAEQAKGDIFCLQASDDYPQPDRNQKAWDGLQDNDWFHSRYFYQYSLNHQKLIKYDKETFNDNWKTGYNISIRTDLVRKIKETQQIRGIDFFLFNDIKPQRIFYDQSDPAGGVSTDGLNTLSKSRHTYYTNVRPPFVDTEKTIDTIGLPKAIADKIKNTILPYETNIDFTKKLTGKRVKVLLKKNFKGRRAGHEYYVDEALRNYLRYRGVLEDIRTETTKSEQL